MLSGASRVGSELAFAFGKPSLRSTTCLPSWRKLHKRFLRKSQAYEKDHGNHNPVLPWHKRRPGAIIPSSICAWEWFKTGFY
ncbi:MAG: hypothetical protein PHD82_11955 [Candidatus Riflebacteria bacterium]|nr:hypothetical protein [Candidatus Riflebacteria bacterium]